METSRGAAAAPTWIVRGHESRRRRGSHVDSPWRRVAARPRPRRGNSFEIGSRLRYKSPARAEKPSERLARRRRQVAALVEPLRRRGRPCCVFEFASFPWGTAAGREDKRERFEIDRDAAHPADSVALDDWHAIFSGLDRVDARYVVLRRDAVAATWSHRQWDGGFAAHGAVLADCARYFRRVETVRGDAAAATWIVRGDCSRQTPRPRRG